MVNKVILIGNVGADPEIKYLDNGTTIANLSLATTDYWKDKDGVKKDKTEWHNIVIFGKLAEIAEKYVMKGSKLYVEGSINYESYEKDGVKKYATKIKVREMRFIGRNSENGNNQSSENNITASDASTSNESDDIPF